MLLNKEDVFEILRCPRTGSPLRRVANRLFTDSDSGNVEYEVIRDYPVLIDFDESVLTREDVDTLSSVTERRLYQGILGIGKRLVSQTRCVTGRNVEQIMDLLFTSQETAQVLIVGGGTIGKGMEAFYEDPRIGLVSFDIYASENVQFLADAHNIPLPDRYFDAVIVQAVLEHVLEPSRVVSEIHRVLKSSALVYAETPFLQHVHEGAYDFTRFTESGHRYLFREFELIRSGVHSGAGTQLLWSIDNFVRGLFRSRQLGKAVKLFFFWLQYCDHLIPQPYNIDAASAVFFLGRKGTSQMGAKDAIAHYGGAQKGRGC